MADLLKVLADESRLRILGLLLEGPRTVSDLAEATRLGAPTVSHHLKRLGDAGLARATVRGHFHVYAADRAALQDTVGRLLPPAAPRAAESRDDRVLRTFVRDDRLVSIPAQRTKRQVVLRWLAGRFEVGRTYTEREVNVLLSRSHDDVATLRRELVASRLLARADGRYVRADGPGHPATEPHRTRT
jgi:hypothetical protein